MQDALQTINLRRIFELTSKFNVQDIIDNDFILGESSGASALSDSRILELLHYPMRFDGYILFFLKKGHFRIDFNLSTYEVHEGSLLITVPGNIIKLEEVSKDIIAESELIYVVLSRDFVSGLKLDFNKVFHESIRMLQTPCVVLDKEQLSLAESYFRLAKQIMQSPFSNKKEIISGLLSSLSYIAEEIWTAQLQEKKNLSEEGGARATQTFERFMKLVTEYHGSERGMQFYADKLCLTPKYLSKIVKEASGISGPVWIDAFVILEAKNLLRYSDESIKEIVYKLNFPSPSVFNKFFKLHTGMSPSDYRKEKRV